MKKRMASLLLCLCLWLGILTIQALAARTDWVNVPNCDEIRLSTPGTYYIYVKASDKAGNTTYVGTPPIRLLGAPAAGDFTFTPPSDLVYDGGWKWLRVEIRDELTCRRATGSWSM